MDPVPSETTTNAENYIEQPLRISENCPKDKQDEKHLFNKG